MKTHLIYVQYFVTILCSNRAELDLTILNWS